MLETFSGQDELLPPFKKDTVPLRFLFSVLLLVYNYDVIMRHYETLKAVISIQSIAIQLIHHIQSFHQLTALPFTAYRRIILAGL